MEEMMLMVFYTGDLITPDGSDSFDGEPCEPGYGVRMESGWVDAGWSLGEVYENRGDVRPDAWGSEDGDQGAWLVQLLRDRLGWIDAPESSEGGTFYSADGNMGPSDCAYTGVRMRLAAHVEGASPELLRRVCVALAHEQRRTQGAM